jgi:hypothetical protein
MQKLNDFHAEMHVWDKETLKKPAKRIKKMKTDLERLRKER